MSCCKEFIETKQDGFIDDDNDVILYEMLPCNSCEIHCCTLKYCPFCGKKI